MNMKRTDYLSWKETFTLMSEFMALKSKMPIKKGACIVSKNNLVLSLGYNGFPIGMEIGDIKYDPKFYEISAIKNAILFSRRNLEDTTLYTTHFPNEFDTKYLIQNGIKTINYIHDIEEEIMYISTRMLKSIGVTVCKLDYFPFKAILSAQPSFEEMFIGLSNIISFRSKDPSTQVGACLVDGKNRIISLGYNGLPLGCNDDEFPWGREGNYRDTKYPQVVHAEANAIAIAQRTSPIDLSGSRIFTSLFSCNDCAGMIIQSGITEVNYISDKYSTLEGFASARDMLEFKGIKLIRRNDVPIIK